MEREEGPASARGTREVLVAGLHADLAEVPVETVRRCINDLWSCCVHLGIRPEAAAIEGLALSRLAGMARGPRCAGRTEASTDIAGALHGRIRIDKRNDR